jgi:hypothetical protein
MERGDIRALVEQYRATLVAECATKTHAERLQIAILADATIDGKNAEARKRQGQEALAQSEAYQVAQRAASAAEIDRLATRAEIDLTRAWLYSQSGH